MIDLYLRGRYDLDRFVSETIALDQVEEAFAKMQRNEVLRSVVVLRMPDASTLALFTVAAITLLVIPGPSVLYIVTRSVDQGRAAGWPRSAASTSAPWCTWPRPPSACRPCWSSATAYNAVRWLGAAYLVWLGVRRLLARDEPSGRRRTRRPRLGLRRIFAQGVVVNVLNPKTALFFFAFLPQFVDTARGSVPFQVVVFGVAFVLLGLLSDGAYACWPRPGPAGCAAAPGWPRRRGWSRAGS